MQLLPSLFPNFPLATFTLALSDGTALGSIVEGVLSIGRLTHSLTCKPLIVLVSQLLAHLQESLERLSSY
jgi:hypothetical protein